MKIYLFLSLAFIFLSNNAFSQEGCTDPLATNYDSSAITNDGSCEYPSTDYTLTEIAVLPSTISETSGLVFFDNQLWTHNDAGGEDKIYQIDTVTGAVVESAIILGADNKDWEDLAQDETYVYIGDFGNNNGSRMNLRVYRIAKSELASGTASAELIEFEYPDQTVFSYPNSNANNYDCEAFFCHNDSLHLFSKNWLNLKTKHYVIPATPGDHVAELRDSLEVNVLITGADMSEDGVIALLGYDPFANYLWLFWDYQGTDFFSGNKRKISLGSTLTNSQTEGITFRNGGYGYISSENLALIDPKLLSFHSSQWTSGTPLSALNVQELQVDFSIFPNPFIDEIKFNLKKSTSQNTDNQYFTLAIADLYGKILKTTEWEGGHQFSWNVADLNLATGVYFLQIKNEEGFAVFSILKK